MTNRLSVLAAFVRRDWGIARSYRFALALDVIDLVVFLLLFYFVGKLVGDSEAVKTSQVAPNYISFVAVGISVMGIMQVGLTSFALKLRRDQNTGTLEALLITPTSYSWLILGSATYDVLRAAGLGAGLLAIGVVFFGVDLDVTASALGILVLAIPTALLLFIGLGVAIAAVVIVFKEIASLLALAATALAILGGVYFPLSVLPEPVQAIAEASPFTWALEVIRAALLGGSVSTAQLVALVIAAPLVIPLALAVLEAAVRRAKRTGTLAQY